MWYIKEEAWIRIGKARQEHTTKAALWILSKGRYKEAFNDQSVYNRNSGKPKPVQQPVVGPWQIILKITGARCNRTKRGSFSKGGAMFEVMVDAIIRAKHHGFQGRSF